MTKTKTASKYSDSRWQKKRLEVMNRDGFKCKSCGAEGDGVTLNVHHSFYEKGLDPWAYDNDTLITLCEDCHEERHWMQQSILGMMSEHTNNEIWGLYLMSFGYPKLMKLFSDFQAKGVSLSPDLVYEVVSALANSFVDGSKYETEKAGYRKS
jgi:hypothetical protein